MRQYRVERYVPGITSGRLNAELGRIEAAAGEVAAGGGSVRYLGSSFAAEEESCFSSFEAGSLDAVERVYQRAGISFAHIVEVEERLPGRERRRHRQGVLRAEREETGGEES